MIQRRYEVEKLHIKTEGWCEQYQLSHTLSVGFESNEYGTDQLTELNPEPLWLQCEQQQHSQACSESVNNSNKYGSD